MAAMRSAALAVVLLVASGCDSADPIEPTASVDLATGAIHLWAQLRSNGTLVQVTVTLHDGDGYPVVLTGGDELLLSAPGGPEARLVEYEGALYGQLETGAASLELVLARAGGRVVSPVELPPAFALSGPPEPAPRSQPIPITWDAGDGSYQMRFEIGGPCLPSWYIRPFSMDPGAYDIQPADLGAPPDTEGCALTFEAYRSALSLPLAPELAPSSTASAEQVRVLVIDTVP